MLRPCGKSVKSSALHKTSQVNKSSSELCFPLGINYCSTPINLTSIYREIHCYNECFFVYIHIYWWLRYLTLNSILVQILFLRKGKTSRSYRGSQIPRWNLIHGGETWLAYMSFGHKVRSSQLTTISPLCSPGVLRSSETPRFTRDLFIFSYIAKDTRSASQYCSC